MADQSWEVYIREEFKERLENLKIILHRENCNFEASDKFWYFCAKDQNMKWIMDLVLGLEHKDNAIEECCKQLDNIDNKMRIFKIPGFAKYIYNNFINANNNIIKN